HGRRRASRFSRLRHDRAQGQRLRVRAGRVTTPQQPRKQQDDRMIAVRCWPAIVALLSLALATPATSLERDTPREPLNLARASYFFVGGKIDTSVEGSPMFGQMYVEYMIPARRSHPYPIVMVHGGSQTGTNFTGTPDGREGWAQYFVRRGYAVYVV